MNNSIVYFDIETQELISKGKHISDMRMSVGVVMTDDDYMVFTEGQVHKLLQILFSAELVVGFNVKNFDYTVLSGYTDEWEAAKADAGVGDEQTRPRTFDLFEDIKAKTKQWPSLEGLGVQTLGIKKIWSGKNVVDFWLRYKLDEVIAHCKQDVELLRQLYQKYMAGEPLSFVAKRNRKLYQVQYEL